MKENETAKPMTKVVQLNLSETELMLIGHALACLMAKANGDMLTLVVVNREAALFLRGLGETAIPTVNGLNAQLAKLMAYEHCPDCGNWHPKDSAHAKG